MYFSQIVMSAFIDIRKDLVAIYGDGWMWYLWVSASMLVSSRVDRQTEWLTWPDCDWLTVTDWLWLTWLTEWRTWLWRTDLLTDYLTDWHIYFQHFTGVLPAPSVRPGHGMVDQQLCVRIHRWWWKTRSEIVNEISWKMKMLTKTKDRIVKFWNDVCDEICTRE